jgi:hypothetical protein
MKFRMFDPDYLADQYRFRPPVLLVYFLSGIAIARFHAYLWLVHPWSHPILIGLWAVLGIVASLTGVSAYQRYLANQPPIGESEAKILFFLAISIVLLVVGYGLESAIF